MKFNEILKKIKNSPEKILVYIFRKLPFSKYLKDESYLKIIYYLCFRKKLDFSNPLTFNEKLQFLKIYDRNSFYSTLVDKYEVKKYIGDIIGNEHIIPTLGVYNNFDDIDFYKLPDKFVIKCTHDSGGLVICKNKDNLDFKSAKRKINKSLKNNFYYVGREWPYKSVVPRIIVEEYMEDNKSKDLKDYKFFVFNGKIRCVQVDYDRFTDHKRCFYDENWERLRFTTCYPTDYSIEIECPEQFDEMKNIVSQISNSVGNIPFLRVDLYFINNKIYFGECTFYHGSGFERFYPPEWDKKLGDYIDLMKVD